MIVILFNRRSITEIMDNEKRYIKMRIRKAGTQSILFYINRIFPIKKRKIVFTCIEGTTGYSCNPKYIAEKLIEQNKKMEFDKQYELVWLVNDINKCFPNDIKVYKNNLWNRAHQLSTAHFWIDNSRKQLECRKRKGQIYIQTWHAKIGFKPTCLDRGESFSKIAYLVSKHDSELVDEWLSNSEWYDKTLHNGSLYDGPTLRTGSPRCDVLINGKEGARKKVREKYGLPGNAKILMYAPTFRGGSQSTNRKVEIGNDFPDYKQMKESFEKRFGGDWYIMLRLHPQIVARELECDCSNSYVLDVSKVDDMYEILAGCDAFMTDYSSAAFDAAVMRIPIFLYVPDYKLYVGERGNLLWDLKKLPFYMAENDNELNEKIMIFNELEYQKSLETFFKETGMVEDGHASERVVKWINDNAK